MTSTIEKELFARQGLRFLRWTRHLFLVLGVTMLSYVGITLLYAKFDQQAANDSLDQEILADNRKADIPSERAVKEGEVLGRIEIPRLGLKVAILQGTSSATLRAGAGHIEGTPLPGERGNTGIAGHRDTWFRDLKDVRASDEILVETATGVGRYQVDWIQITNPADVGILAPSNEYALTLVTCFPFHFIGAAPERFVVHAHKL